MAEALGEALLVLRTDDRGLDAGITNAKGKSEALGRTLDATSGSATKLGRAMDDAGSSASGAGTKTGEYSREVAKLKASIDPAWGALQKFKEEAQVARQALDAGAISHKQYVDVMRQNATAAGLLTGASAKVTAATAAQRQGTQQLLMNLGDMSTMYQLGARPAQIFSSQIGQVTQAIQLMAGGTSKFATFLGGPWGIAIMLAAQVLGPFVGMLFEGESAADKAAKANETFADKLDRTKHSLLETTAAVRDYIAEQKKSRETTLESAEAAAKAAAANLKEALTIRQKVAAKLAEAQAAFNAQSGGGKAGQEYKSGLGAEAYGLTQQLAANDAEIVRLTKDAADANSELADQLAQIDADPTKKIREGFQKLREDARATIKDVTQLRTRLGELYKQEEAAVAKERKANRSSTPSASQDASVGDMTALLKTLFPGATITSTTGGKHKAGSDHYAGRAIDFVPQGGMGQYSTAEVEKILEDAGVEIRRNAKGTKQFFGPGRSAATPGDHDDHFHVAWKGSASPEEAQRRREQAEDKRKREEEKEAQRVERYTRDLAGLDAAALELRTRMADTAEERFQLESQGLEIAIAEQKRRIVDNKDYTDAEKAKLLVALEVKATLERELLAKRKQEELARQALETAQALWENERSLLDKQLQLSTVREERKAIEQKILDEQYKQLRQELEFTAKNASDERDRAKARNRLAQLDQEKALDQRRLDQDYESPLERYRREVVGVGNNINDEMEKVTVKGLDALNDGLTDVIMNAKSLGDVFKGVAKQIIADLVRIAIQQTVILPLLRAMNGGGGGVGGLQGTIDGLANAGSGGGGLGSTIGSILTSITSIFSGFFADGGLIPNGSFGIVGEAGPEPVFATAGGIGVLPNSALRSMGGGGPGYLHVSVSGARGNAEIEDMVASGVRQGLASYDRIVSDRVQDHLERRG